MKGLICLVLALAATPALARDEHRVSPISLAALGAKAEVIVLGQVKDTDYFYRHGYPVSGSAYLKILIPYRIDQPTDIIEVRERGLHANECYFPNPTVFEEGRRYLLFLQRDPDQPERYRGLAEGCALDVLVTVDHRYVLRYPVTGIDLTDALAGLAVEMQFGDSYATVDEDSLSSTARNVLLDAGLIAPIRESKKHAGSDSSDAPPNEVARPQWIYTRGIDLVAIRKMLGPMQDR